MEKIINLKDLFINQVEELFQAEKQQIDFFNFLESAAIERALKDFIADQLRIAEGQANRLENILLLFSKSLNCKGIMNNIFEEMKRSVEITAESEVRDASIIRSLQYVKHLEIAGYGTACTYAMELDFPEQANELHKSLDEERNADEKLTELAKEKINLKAMAGIII